MTDTKLQPLLTWTPAISVGNEELDGHHKHMVELVNQIHHAVNTRANQETVSGYVTELLDYANYHFGAEEALFVDKNYPLETEHIEDHLAFREQLSEIRDLVEVGAEGATARLLDALFLWWTHHITKFDIEYSPFLKRG